VASGGTIGFALVDADYTVRLEPGEMVARLEKCAAGKTFVAEKRQTAPSGS
jgi:hypothetical protein